MKADQIIGEAFGKSALRLVQLYRRLTSENPDIQERDLFLSFEKEFGDELVEKVCVPYHFTQGACLVACIEYAKMHA